MNPYNVLAVDDEIHVLNALRRTLRREYNIFTATSGEDALVVMEQEDIALIITDYRMPGMTGLELLEKILQKCPDTIRMIITSYADQKLLMDAINVGHVHRYIPKPWEPEEVRSIVREGIGAYERIRANKEASQKKIGQILIDHGIISESQLETALELQKCEKEHVRRKLGEILIHLGYTNEEGLFFCYAVQLGMPYISLSQFSIRRGHNELLPSELAYKHAIVPVDKIGPVLVVATSEPLSDRVMSEIGEETGCKIKAVCTSLRDIEAALEEYYPKQGAVEEELEHQQLYHLQFQSQLHL
jgi:CheY-like chemotaxis protein